MDTSHLHPFVIWQSVGVDHHVYRLVDRGPAREDKNEPQFIFERGAGHDGMYVKRWVPLKTGEHHVALHSIIEVFGKLLGLKSENLVAGHLVGCDINISAIEGRDIRGCDCLGAPGRYGLPDPSAGQRRDVESLTSNCPHPK